MIKRARCRLCGRTFDADYGAVVDGRRRLCPRCRGPLPPIGAVPAMDEGLLVQSDSPVAA